MVLFILFYCFGGSAILSAIDHEHHFLREDCPERYAFEWTNPADLSETESAMSEKQGDTWRREGDRLVREGDNKSALEAYDRALASYAATAEVQAQGVVWLRKSDVYLQAGDHALALEMCDRALPFFVQSGSDAGQGSVWLSKGSICFRSGDNARGIEFFDKALACYEKAADPEGQGQVWLIRGDFHNRRNENELAIATYEKALSFLKRTGSRMGQGNAWRSIGNVRLKMGDYAGAQEMYDKAMPFFRQVASPIGQGLVWRARGDICFQTGDDANALTMYDRALAHFEPIGVPESVAYTVLNKAKVLCRMGRVEEVVPLVETALNRLERVRTGARSPELKKRFMEKIYKRYESAVLLFLDHRLGEQAFRLVEAMKARGFLDRLAEERLDLSKEAPAEWKGQWDLLQEKRMVVSRAYSESLGRKEEIQAERLAREKKSVEKEIEQLEETIRLKSPRYAAIQYPVSVTLKEMKEKVLQRGEVLAEYFLTDEGCYVFLVTREDFEVKKIDLAKKELEQEVHRYLELVRSRRNGSAQGKRLYRALLGPWEGNLKRDAALIVVPDGILSRIPWETLPAGEEKGRARYLLEKRKVSYIQSASVLSFLRSRASEATPEYTFIGFGDPVYPEEKQSAGGKPSSRSDRNGVQGAGIHMRGIWEKEGFALPRLPESAGEVTGIGNLFPAGKNRSPKLLLRQAASESAAKDPQMKWFRYIHFACHGLLADDGQVLALSRNPGDGEDGFLELGEIMNLDWNARLVVLSACDTGMGKLERGEGVSGLTRAVMYAGTSATVAGLWGVSDEGTADLMKRFYRRLVKKKESPSAALRQAKLGLLRSDRFSHPFFWGGFVLYGE